MNWLLAFITLIYINLYSYKATFTLNDYAKLLTLLEGDKFIVLPLNEMRSTIDSTKVIIGLRHDIDIDPYRALQMARIEKKIGIRATYFVLPDAMYFRYMNLSWLYKELHDNGHEIGIHNDLLKSIVHRHDPIEVNKANIGYFNSLGIEIHGTASHGSTLAKKTIPNYQIFQGFGIGLNDLQDYGFEYEAYFIDFNQYYSDSGGKWNDDIMKRLNDSKAGDRIEILVHPEWWK